MYRDDWVTVIPGYGEEARVRAELMALAQHPGHIRTAGGAGEFLIPPYLADLYNAPAPEPKPRRRIKKEEGEE